MALFLKSFILTLIMIPYLYSSYGETSLEHEILSNIKNLLLKGINATDKYGRTPLFLAAQENEVDLIKNLLKERDIQVDKADDQGLSPLAIAANQGNFEAVKALLNECYINGAKIRTTNRCPNLNAVDNKIGYTPLMRAAKSGHEDIINLLLNVGADPFKKSIAGKTALELIPKDIPEIKNKIAIFERNIKFMQALLQTNFNEAKKILAQGIDANFKWEEGQTPLMLAAAMGEIEIVKTLINEGANLNERDIYGRSAIFDASRYGHKEIFDLLVSGGALVNLQDRFGTTPLIFAVRYGHPLIVKRLLSTHYNFDLQHKNNLGESAISIAKENMLKGDNYRQIFSLLNDVIINEK